MTPEVLILLIRSLGEALPHLRSILEGVHEVLAKDGVSAEEVHAAIARAADRNMSEEAAKELRSRLEAVREGDTGSLLALDLPGPSKREPSL